jgi:excisionase family DNA binding protein
MVSASNAAAPAAWCKRPELRAPLQDRQARVETVSMAVGSLEPVRRSMELSISQVAERLGVSIGTVRRWADAGHVASYRTPGGQRRFSAAEVETFVAKLERR